MQPYFLYNINIVFSFGAVVQKQRCSFFSVSENFSDMSISCLYLFMFIMYHVCIYLCLLCIMFVLCLLCIMNYVYIMYYVYIM